MGTWKRVVAISGAAFVLAVAAGCSSSSSHTADTEAPTSAVTVPVPTSKPAPASTTKPAPTVPGAPVPVSAVPYGSGVAKLIWNPPATNGGSPITAYVVTPFIGPTAQKKQAFQSPSTSDLIAGLQNGKVYQFEIAAVNAVGIGAFSPHSGSMTVGSPGQPGGPTVAKAGSGSLRVSFKPPANNGATITSYAATCRSSNGGISKTKTGKATPITVAALTPSKTYTCSVNATNSRGTGPSTSPSKPVTS
jgi:Fibronectin type III domain